MSIAIIGGCGFLGSSIARALVSTGADVVQIARGKTTTEAVSGAKLCRADRTDQAALERIFADQHVTVAIDVLTLTLASAQPLMAATANAGARYVMISAIDVTANYGGLAGLENPAVLTRPTNESDPRRKALFPYRRLPSQPAGIDVELLRDYDKIPIEDAALSDPQLNALILRLPAIYGPNDPQGRFVWLTDAMRAGGPIRMDERAFNWLQSFVFIEDAGAAVAKAALSDIPSQVLHIASQRHDTMGQWATRFLAAAGYAGPVETRPPEAKALMYDRAELFDMRYPLTLDGARFEALFGSVETVSENAAVAATLAHAGL